MRLEECLSKLIKPELDNLKIILNLTEEQEIIFYLVAKRKSLVEISMKTGFSITTIKRRKRDIVEKVRHLIMVKIIQNGEIKDIGNITLSEETIKLISSLIA